MTCTSCHDTGWRSHDVDGVERVERCECWRQRVTQDLLREANIPSRYHKCDFQAFVTYPNEQLLRTVKKAEEFAAAFPVVQKGLLLIGHRPLREAAKHQPLLETNLERACTEKGLRQTNVSL